MERLHRRELISEVRADRDRLRSQLESLHKRIRALAMDCGAVQTEDAVEDIRRALETRKVRVRKAGAATLEEMANLPEHRRAAICDEEDAARRLAAARGEKT